jgi:hypothetical protein
MEKAMAGAGARLVENAPVETAVAEVAASTGTPVGALVGTVVDGAVLVMNANDAATVLQTGTAMVQQFGPARAAEIIGGIAKTGAEVAVNAASAGSSAALTNVGNTLGMPSPPP